MFSVKKTTNTIYINYKYPQDHWALDSTKEGTCIGFIKIDNLNIYSVKLNPTDSRGYRILVTFVGDLQSDIQSTFNRTYTLSEQRGLSDATTFMVEVFKRIGVPIVQTAQAGNNSHGYDEQNGMVLIGNELLSNLVYRIR